MVYNKHINLSSCGGDCLVQIFYADTKPLNDDETFSSFYEKVSARRQKKINSFRFRKDKNLCLGASALLDVGLRESGLTEKEMIYSEQKNQKPFFTNHPEIFFNISHSGNYAAAAFSDSEIGIDIEKIKDADLKIAKRFFAEEEYKYLEKISDKEKQNREFYRLWTLKESFMKVTGLGMSLPLNEFCIHINDIISVTCDRVNNDFYFYEYDGIDGFCLSVCSVNKNEKTEFIKISLKG